MAQPLDANTRISALTELGARIPAVKAPSTRLMDLTAGWSAFVQQEDDTVIDTGVSVDDLTTLYQAAGQLEFDGPDADPEEEARQVRAFVEERVLPLLLKTA